MKRTIVGLGLLALALVLLFNATPAHATDLWKVQTSGPEVIQIYLDEPTELTFEICTTGRAVVFDTVPAEFEVVDLNATWGTADWVPANGKYDGKSASKIEWHVPGPEPCIPKACLTVNIKTRPSPGKRGGGEELFKPTSCEWLSLNDGAIAYKADEFGNLLLDGDGNPIFMAETGPIPIEAVEGGKECDD